MKYSQARQGRVFVIRLEDGEIIHEVIENFAREKSIGAASLIIIGGVDAESRLVVGPEEGRGEPIRPMEHRLTDVHEITGTGTLFPNERGEPVLHMHIACGRKETTLTGCVRRGVRAWQVLEVVLTELTENSARRIHDKQTGFELLEP
jgi:predicted DNA-binding protein with PD1-like motif